jgi:hypothetical protein
LRQSHLQSIDGFLFFLKLAAQHMKWFGTCEAAGSGQPGSASAMQRISFAQSTGQTERLMLRFWWRDLLVQAFQSHMPVGTAGNANSAYKRRHRTPFLANPDGLLRQEGLIRNYWSNSVHFVYFK